MQCNKRTAAVWRKLPEEGWIRLEHDGFCTQTPSLCKCSKMMVVIYLIYFTTISLWLI